ncbi:hypothetical protein QQ020_18925 [Fulvivirgaceae bacterium BMA12]|uniref:Lipoprotein n=1 Tax=Agaribacillus aureus TaxID=3051825 RepID=A0ABT8LCX2_9BACT|nr:hypothetical protein [Fulvivirgaceae bacterium BMA12]
MRNFIPHLILIVCLILLICAASCTPQLVPYTARVQGETGLGEAELKKVQFYNSDRIVLFREVGKNTTEIVSGEIKIVDGKQIEEIVINPLTPGVLVNSADGKRFGISFEQGPDRYLVFGLNPRKAGTYSIYGRDWRNHIATVDYDGKEFKLAPQSSESILLVNLKKLNGLKVNSRTARGRSVN